MISSILRSYPEEFALHLEGRCSVEPRTIHVPKLVDVADGVATYDQRHASKQRTLTGPPRRLTSTRRPSTC